MKAKRLLMMTAVAACMIGARADAQNLFVSDFWADSIYYFTPDGVRNTFATGLNRPAGIAFDKAGNLFVSDYHSGNIYKYTPNGVRSTFASGLASSRVWGIAFDQAGNLYGATSGVGVPGSGSVFKWTANGQRSTFASGPLYAPYVLAFDSADNLYVSNLGNNIFTDTILKFTPSGARSTFASGLFNTTGMAFDSAGNLFVQEAYAGSKVYKITPSGVRTTFANFYGISLGFDSQGRLLQGDDSGNIYQLSPQGTRTLYASGLARPSAFALQVPKPPPVLICPQPLTLECTNGSAVGTVQIGVLDTNGFPVQVVWTVDGIPYQTNDIPSRGTITASNVTFTANFGEGEHTVVISASNGQAPPVSCSTTVTVGDTTPPMVSHISVTPSSLWPPNHRMVPVSVTLIAVDNCDPSPGAHITSVTSNEPQNPIAPDWEITGPLSVNLRAERLRGKGGRIYTIVVVSEDGTGNVAYGSVDVVVPHDHR